MKYNIWVKSKKLIFIILFNWNNKLLTSKESIKNSKSKNNYLN